MIVAADLNTTTAADASSEMTAVVAQTETTVPTVAIGTAPNAETTTSLSDTNATDVASHAATVAEDVPTTVDSKVANNGHLDLSETIVKTTAWMAIGIAQNATMITSLGEPNAISAAHQRQAAVKDGHPAETTEGRSTTVTIEVATDEVATDEVATDEVEKHSTTTIGIALNATTPISHSDKNATDVEFHEAVAKVGHHDAMTDEVAIHEVEAVTVVAANEAATDEVAIHEAEAVTVAEANEAATDEAAIHEAEAVTVAEASEVATAAVPMTAVVETDKFAVTSVATEAGTMDVVHQESHENHENFAKPEARVRAMPTTAHHAT